MRFTLLGGRLHMEGPPTPEDALWLAAAVAPLPPGARVLDAGAGSGVAGLALLLRQPQLRVVGVEVDEALAVQAAANAALNGMADRYESVVSDVMAFDGGPFTAALCNPPFHAAARGHGGPAGTRRRARHMPANLLEDWLRKLLTLVEGPVYLLLHAAEKQEFKAVAGVLGFQARVVPLATHATRPPKRLLVILEQGVGYEELPPLPLYEKNLRAQVLEEARALTL